MRILFMGTPDIAAECLKALYAAGHDICAVYTRRDKPVGRKQVLTAPPVKEVALAHGTPVFQPRTLRDGGEDANIQALAPELIVVVVPSVAMRSVAQRLRGLPVRPDAVIVSCTKGIEQGSHKRMTEILQEYLPSNPIGVLSGPNHAEDICLGLPSASLIGFEDPKYADWVQQIFASKTFRVYSATDIIGMQLGGTIKNVFAIGAGLCEGLNLGDNAQAALLTRGLAEMTRIGVASGGRRETFMGLSGVGDLIVTCYSRHSRNQTVGRRLAEGKSLQEILDALGMVAEGVPNTLSVYEIARKLGVRTPLIDAVYSVLYESKPPMEALVELMTRDPRPELD